MSVRINFTFCPPPLGKPDPTEFRPESGPDTRRRVVQLNHKHNTPTFAAYNLLRDRWKAPNTEDLPQRKFERKVSFLRKVICKHDRSLPTITNGLAQQDIQFILSKIDKLSIDNMQYTIDRLDQDAPANTVHPNPCVLLNSVVPAFKTQTTYNNMFEYLKFLKIDQKQEIYQEFFDQIQTSPETLYQEIQWNDPYLYLTYFEGSKWEELEEKKKNAIRTIALDTVIPKVFGFKISTWGPSQPFSSLKSALETHGPLIVTGIFGEVLYHKPAERLQMSIEGREVYGWRTRGPVEVNPISGTAVLLVGTETIGTKNLVYYINPEDPSDPAHPEKQRIFCMSYERLIAPESLCDLYGFRRPNAPQEVGYALYHN